MHRRIIKIQINYRYTRASKKVIKHFHLNYCRYIIYNCFRIFKVQSNLFYKLTNYDTNGKEPREFCLATL